MQQALALAAVSMAVLAMPALAQDLPDGTDPVFAEAYDACFAAIAGGGVLREELGWTGHDSGDPEAVAWDNWSRGFATKELAGVGGANLSFTVEKYPGYLLGLCTVRIDAPAIEIDGPVLKSAPGFTGSLMGDGGAWSGVWRNDSATLFVRSTYSEAEHFVLSMTFIADLSSVTVQWRGEPVFLPHDPCAPVNAQPSESTC
jgi:hypothetical protein